MACALVGSVAGTSGCGSRRALLDHPADSAAAGSSTTGTAPEEPTIGERLGQLDARMRTAPPDSLPRLQEEYNRLLAERTGEPGLVAPTEVQTGGPQRWTFPVGAIDTDTLPKNDSLERWLHYGEDTIVIDTTVARPRRNNSELVTSDTPRDPLDIVEAAPRPEEPTEQATPAARASSPSAPTAPLAATGDPSKLFRGLRPSEIATIPGHEEGGRSSLRASAASRRAPARLSARDATSTRPRGRTNRRGASDDRLAAAAASSSTSLATPQRRADAINTRGARKGLVEGIAAARAGKYADAVTKLEPAVKAGSAGAEAGYYYALSLEKTGQFDRAASQYLRASKSGGALAQRSYLDYCRLLARSGKRQKARDLLTQFLRRNPDSTQAVTARRLLQTL